MTTRSLQNYLRMYRKRSGLTQAEVGCLLGWRSGSKVSRLERCERIPSLETALAYEVVFKIPVRKLFAGTFDDVERRTLTRIGKLAEQLLKAQKDEITQQKLEALASAVRQAGPVFEKIR
jgi:transcriptional regulator with XRE-family HTH domain